MIADGYCPFCGSESIDDTCQDVEYKPDGKTFYFVFCNDCEACGPTSYDKAEAKQLWRQRATEPAEPKGSYDGYDLS